MSDRQNTNIKKYEDRHMYNKGNIERKIFCLTILVSIFIIILAIVLFKLLTDNSFYKECIDIIHYSKINNNISALSLSDSQSTIDSEINSSIVSNKNNVDKKSSIYNFIYRKLINKIKFKKNTIVESSIDKKSDDSVVSLQSEINNYKNSCIVKDKLETKYLNLANKIVDELVNKTSDFIKNQKNKFIYEKKTILFYL